MTIGDHLVNIQRDLEDVKVQLGNEGSAAYFDYVQNDLTIKNPYTVVDTRDTGSSFTIGHTTWGKLGVQTPQPVLGSVTSTAWVTSRITSPKKSFEEGFGMTRFKSGTTTADWNTGSDSCYFTSGEKAESGFIALTSGTTYTSGMLAPMGSTVTNLDYTMSANGGVNYTTFTSGTWKAFETAGSAITWKAVENVGSILTTAITSRLDTVQVNYGGDSL